MRILPRFVDRMWQDPPPILREARMDDAATLAVLHATGFARGWSEIEFERLLLDRTTVAHVATRRGGGDAAIAAILSRLVADEAEVLTVIVAPSNRHRGYARTLLAHHLDRLADHGARTVFLEVAEDNPPACRLYKGAGFVEVGRRAGYYPRPQAPVAALTLRCDLD